MEERSRRIVETAVELAEQGGFEAVRLRDVASRAGVALGTLYRRFRSKEDLLVAAMERETDELEQRVLQRPPRGDTPFERVTAFFSGTTRGLLRRPNLARAMLRATTAGDLDLSGKVRRFHDRLERMIVASLRGEGHSSEPLTQREKDVAWALEMIWFSALVGWSGGRHGQSTVIEHMRRAAELLLGDAEETR
ncbi:MAG: TetR family transcriptional regulator [Proteobacteria bacterium]|nr:TetR family transcriptional regulator [Pseudomonadota bacterium]